MQTKYYNNKFYNICSKYCKTKARGLRGIHEPAITSDKGNQIDSLFKQC